MRTLIVVLTLILAPAIGWAEDFQIPQMNGPVVDQAGLLDSAVKGELDLMLRAVHERGGPQVGILTVKSLGGLPIEEASIRTVEAWKLGNQKKDDGVLLLIAPTERKLRIEVGQGLEGDLTDVAAGRIVDRVIVPYFREGNAAKGIEAGTLAILRKVYPDGFKDGELAAWASERGDIDRRSSRGVHVGGGGIPRLGFLVFLILLLIVMSFSRSGRRGNRVYSSGIGLGGALGGGSWRGGGFSGGGGGFSGGGASGGW